MAIFDLNNSSPESIDSSYDYLIIGAGPAGITAALSLIETGKRIAILEAGDREYSKSSQDYYDGEVEGDNYFSLRDCRLRMLGGTSNHWNGWCRELDAFDFEKKLGSKLFEWTIEKGDLAPYMSHAKEILNLNYQTTTKKLNKNLNQLTWDWSRPVTLFGEKYFKILRDSKNISLFLNANFQYFKYGDAIEGAIVRSQNGSFFTFRSSYYALATGGIENTKNLLYSNHINEEKFIKNKNLGKFWMEHPEVFVGGSFINNQDLLRKMINKDVHEKNNYQFFIGPTKEFIGSTRLNACLRLTPRNKNSNEDIDEPLKQWIADSLRELACYDPDFVLKIRGREFRCFTSIKAVFEQPPEEGNRVILDFNNLDPSGLPKAKLIWRKNPIMKKTIIDLLRETGKFFVQEDIGRVYLDDWLFDESIAYPESRSIGGNHHMGGTRMSFSEELGVVDQNLKVFNHSSLYVLGSSVFPSSGHANPTITLTQLSLRWADHMKNKII